jgi:P-aminobenzoate N-oxygenase AurF
LRATHGSIENSAVDYSRHFIPEPSSPLFYTAAYAELTEEQRLRYNQLHGCYCNEQIMFLERSVADPVLEALLQSPLAHAMAVELRTFLDEERQHTDMLRDLNRRCMPQLYSQSDFYFLALPRGVAWLLARVAGQPRFFPLFIWLMFLEEERAVFFGREIIRQKEELEPHFVSTHRLHLADEIEHVKWDQETLTWLWPRTAPALRTMNARLLRWIIGEFFTAPKRANLRVVEELVREFPDLRLRLPEMRNQLVSLRENEQWNRFLHSRTVIPKTISDFARWPEFDCLNDLFPDFTRKSKNNDAQ